MALCGKPLQSCNLLGKAPQHQHLVSHGAGVQDGFVGHGGKRLVCVHEGGSFSEEDVAKEPERPDKGWQGVLLVEWAPGYIVDLGRMCQGTIQKGVHMP